MKDSYDAEQEERDMELAKDEYNEFIRKGLASGFTDDQVDFLWEYCRKV